MIEVSPLAYRQTLPPTQKSQLGDKFCCEAWAKKSRRQTVLQTTISQLVKGLKIARLHIKHNLDGLKTASRPQDSMVVF